MNVEPKGAGVEIPVDDYVLDLLRLFGLLDKYESAKDAEAKGKVLAAAWRQIWETPPAFARGISKLSGKRLELDVCAEAHTKKAPYYFGPGSAHPDAFAVTSWSSYVLVHGAGWCNPPFNDIPRWSARLLEESKHAPFFLLVPPRTDQRWWHALKAHPEAFRTDILGRPKFLPPKGVKASTPGGGGVVWASGWPHRVLPPSRSKDEIRAAGA